ncbi:hypothetical protein PI124_g7441 [Phytophthora idaei]|nr:hypothetical protein PI125_g11867 [Phytophthora idaei]KAG3151405.1 hypothetical protein PI126_g11029 [Phytophthora idaei]KAG3247872.1 hypothetical protein PI124_g7441 [Phytophthora idaei]
MDLPINRTKAPVVKPPVMEKPVSSAVPPKPPVA